MFVVQPGCQHYSVNEPALTTAGMAPTGMNITGRETAWHRS